MKRYGLKNLEYQGYWPDVLIYAMLIQLSKYSVFVYHVALQIYGDRQHGNVYSQFREVITGNVAFIQLHCK